MSEPHVTLALEGDIGSDGLTIGVKVSLAGFFENKNSAEPCQRINDA
jgi:hypothetical protein